MTSIILNGRPHELDDQATIDSLLASLQLDRHQVVVELNRQIVPRDRFSQTDLAEGDKLEVVQFVGGG
ncbi:MAG: sulfur carrier protein ThiS [Deltaproteobacteria bacterium]|jgi:thiamine biosynthesis protein ThiS|nr:sulfur carrier protein ThiS [Deltaproteobacteria bacterium]